MALVDAWVVTSVVLTTASTPASTCNKVKTQACAGGCWRMCTRARVGMTLCVPAHVCVRMRACVNANFLSEHVVAFVHTRTWVLVCT